ARSTLSYRAGGSPAFARSSLSNCLSQTVSPQPGHRGQMAPSNNDVGLCEMPQPHRRSCATLRTAEAIGASVNHRGEITMNDTFSTTANLDGPVQLTDEQIAAVAGGGGGVRVGSDGAGPGDPNLV